MQWKTSLVLSYNRSTAAIHTLALNVDVSDLLDNNTTDQVENGDYESNKCYPIASNESMQICTGVPSGDKGKQLLWKTFKY